MSAEASQPVERWKENPYGAALGERDVIQALGSTPEQLRKVAERMTADHFGRSYAPGKWTATQLFLHLAQTELAFSLRVRMCVTTDDAYVVQPFDQDAWMAREPLVSGPEAFRGYFSLRQFNLPIYRSLSAADRARTFRHPERGDMRVEWILEMLAGHELHHLKHIEAIAKT